MKNLFRTSGLRVETSGTKSRSAKCPVATFGSSSRILRQEHNRPTDLHETSTLGPLNICCTRTMNKSVFFFWV
jgi:hypothetical protein